MDTEKLETLTVQFTKNLLSEKRGKIDKFLTDHPGRFDHLGNPEGLVMSGASVKIISQKLCKNENKTIWNVKKCFSRDSMSIDNVKKLFGFVNVSLILIFRVIFTHIFYWMIYDAEDYYPVDNGLSQLTVGIMEGSLRNIYKLKAFLWERFIPSSLIFLLGQEYLLAFMFQNRRNYSLS